jgi:hypothetical protein
MAKADAEALNILLDIVNNGGLIQIENTATCYEVTVWPSRHDRLNHHHFQGDTLIEAVMKIK